MVESEIVVEPERPIGPNPVEIYCTGLCYEFITHEREIDKQLQTQIPMDPTSEAHEGPLPGMPVIPDYILEVVCVFPDGNECEEEEFRSGRCGYEYSYCVHQGYTLKQGANGVICIFPDGSSCPEIEFYNGSCGPATNQQIKDTSEELIEIQCAEFQENQHPTADDHMNLWRGT
jgi:putative hemolysin